MESLQIFGKKTKDMKELSLSNKPLLTNGEFVQEIVCGTLHVMVLSNKGRMFSCGFGETYALGHGTKQSYNYFKELESMTDIFRIIENKIQIEKLQCGTAHSGILISKQLFLWGMVTENPSQIF